MALHSEETFAVEVFHASLELLDLAYNGDDGCAPSAAPRESTEQRLQKCMRVLKAAFAVSDTSSHRTLWSIVENIDKNCCDFVVLPSTAPAGGWSRCDYLRLLAEGSKYFDHDPIDVIVTLLFTDRHPWDPRDALPVSEEQAAARRTYVAATKRRYGTATLFLQRIGTILQMSDEEQAALNKKHADVIENAFLSL
jgi:hypothetical protein